MISIFRCILYLIYIKFRNSTSRIKGESTCSQKSRGEADSTADVFAEFHFEDCYYP